MNTDLEHMVRMVIAHRIEDVPESIHPTQHLERDLGIDRLDLVVVALDLEDIESIEFPLSELEHVTTVSDLVALTRSWLSREAFGFAPESETTLGRFDRFDREAPTESGMVPALAEVDEERDEEEEEPVTVRMAS